MTLGFDVFVQLVIAAIRTLPSRMSPVAEAAPGALPKPPSAAGFAREATNSCLSLGSSIRSCGRLGPALPGSTVPSGANHSPCQLFLHT